ncbi:TetR family transcriptional regulator [Acinetobacter silvestris]|uniref:TetR family transcriptional regulator n=1 Tax=Acinetobacter silvestris TaxID=1977882 RepID=A0A1Y3CCI8_9GAMM|nr:TetR family transcriptional regulator [Acinetobacter silvestris]OTG63815.1 TetR family transcriptional regulator [Acinetobacter silvestris]
MSIRDERKQQSRQALLDAALRLSTSGRSFSSISLREVAREVGLVPTAFYRHFQDMDELGKELVDQVALHLQTILHQLGQAYLNHPETKTKASLELFFSAVDQNPAPWIFMIAERWGGAEVVRHAISREIDYLNQEFTTSLEKIESVQHFQNMNDLKVLSNILINLSFTWAMSWINLVRQTPSIELELEKMVLKNQIVTQIQLIFRGISNWERPTT